MFQKKFLRAILLFIPALLFILLFPETPHAAENAPQESRSPATTPAPTEKATAERTLSPAFYDGPFELPLNGATGFAAIDLNLRSSASSSSQKLALVPAGSSFRILDESGAWWRVAYQDKTGYLFHRYCMINLPDVIPSIVYNNTNSYNSLLLSSGKEIPGISGQSLYENAGWNARFEREEFIMPALYTMAKKIQAAQLAALQDGNSLKIYEAYRPYQVQRKVVDAVAQLAENDSAVRAGISTPPWKVSWFVSQGISHHQRGCAIDVSLVRVTETTVRTSGPFSFREVTGFTEYRMPTPIHELSSAAAIFSEPVSSASADAWRGASPAPSANEAALLLQRYCTDAGMTPLASEWWHFNDLSAYEEIKLHSVAGEFTFTEIMSAPPESE